MKIPAIKYQYSTQFLCFLLILSSCTSTDSYLDTEDIASPEYSGEYKIYIINNDTIPYPQIYDYELTDNEIAIANVFEDFAIEELNKHSFNTKSDFVFSPFNASLTFSIMKNAADDYEQKGIDDYIGIHNNYSLDNVNLYNRKVISTINMDTDNINISNKIWVDKTNTIYRSFLSTLNSYDSTIEGIDFNNSSDMQRIDSYIQDKSNPNNASISSECEKGMNSLFSNSIRFSMQWKEKLHPCVDTKNDRGSNNIPSQKLYRYDTFRYADLGFYSIVEIPYSDSIYSMYLIYTPFSDSRYYNVLNDIILNGGIDECIQQMTPTKLHLTFPRFSIETTMSLLEDNDSYLKCYSNVSPNGFILNSVFQVCAIQVDEYGTSAKAIMNPGFDGLQGEKLPPSLNDMELDINGPFWFIIRNNKYKSILFAGIVKEI